MNAQRGPGAASSAGPPLWWVFVVLLLQAGGSPGSVSGYAFRVAGHHACVLELGKAGRDALVAVIVHPGPEEVGQRSAECAGCLGRDPIDCGELVPRGSRVGAWAQCDKNPYLGALGLVVYVGDRQAGFPRYARMRVSRRGDTAQLAMAWATSEATVLAGSDSITRWAGNASPPAIPP